MSSRQSLSFFPNVSTMMVRVEFAGPNKTDSLAGLELYSTDSRSFLRVSIGLSNTLLVFLIITL